MNQKLFWTLTGSFLTAGVVLYFFIRWTMQEEREAEQKRLAEIPMPKQLGFGAEMARQADIAA